jgi:hypothetical protein
MPLAKIRIVEGRYDQAGIDKVSGAIQAALINTLRVPPDDFYQRIFELPKSRFLHTLSFVTLYEVPSANISFGQGEAQRANAAVRA